MYSKGFREAAIILYDTLHSMEKVSLALHISLSTIWSWLRNENKKRSQKPISDLEGLARPEAFSKPGK